MEQPSLFPDEAQSNEPITELDTAAIAASGHGLAAAEAAEKREAELADSRGENLAAEQGRRIRIPVVGRPAPEPWSEPRLAGKRDDPQSPSREKLFELPGKNGRRNPGTQLLMPSQAQQGLTTETIDRQNEINRRGSAVAKAALGDLLNK